MTGIERIETFRRWRFYVAEFPDRYRIGLHKQGTIIIMTLEEYRPNSCFKWDSVERLFPWDTEIPGEFTDGRPAPLEPSTRAYQ